MGELWVTEKDLQKFKIELLNEIRQIVLEGKRQPIKKWLKSSEVRKLLNISPGKLQSMRKSHTINFMRIGGAIYYQEEDIQKMFEENLDVKRIVNN